LGEGGRQSDSGGVRAADTVLSVLEAVAWAGEPTGVTQIANALRSPKGAIFRHLQTLVDRGYLLQDPDTNRYRLGSKAFLIAHLAPPAWDLARVLEPPMREARDATGLAVVLRTPAPVGALVLAALQGTRPIEIGVRPGSELAPHASAQGKVFLAYGVLPMPDALPRFTARTVADADALARELAAVRRDGHATAPEEILLGVNALAAPVRDHSGAVVAAVALVGSIQHIAAPPDEGLVRVVRTAAAKGSMLLGGRTTSCTSRQEGGCDGLGSS
jgi:IclR family transcriptional regulator, KDG regulon repressor